MRPRIALRLLRCLVVVATLLAAPVAAAQVPARSVRAEVVGSVAYLTNGGFHGAALDAGLRLGFGRWFALGFDLGYGVMGGAHVEDRWWIMSSAALVVPLGVVRIDVGGGIGLGAASGYGSFDAFQRGPFDPDWAFQLAPAIRGHAMLAWATSSDASAFARLEVGTLLVDGLALGLRESTSDVGGADTMWITLSLGAMFDV